MSVSLRWNAFSSHLTLSLPSSDFALPSSSSLYVGRKILRSDSGICLRRRGNSHRKRLSTVLQPSGVTETLPPELDSSSEPLQVFDGTTRLYISYTCPYAQRVWITRNYKGLQDKIELVPINLKNRPAWYQEKVYAANKVPALEHNNRVIGESLDLVKYIDSNFEGPSLTPDGLEKQVFAEDLLAYTGSFYKTVTSTFKGADHDALDSAFDYIEHALSRFKEGSFFLGQFSLVDVAYVPFIERFQLISKDVIDVDITYNRPNLALWIQEMNKIEAYTQTRQDPKELVERYKKRVLAR